MPNQFPPKNLAVEAQTRLGLAIRSTGTQSHLNRRVSAFGGASGAGVGAGSGMSMSSSSSSAIMVAEGAAAASESAPAPLSMPRLSSFANSLASLSCISASPLAQSGLEIYSVTFDYADIYLLQKSHLPRRVATG